MPFFTQCPCTVWDPKNVNAYELSTYTDLNDEGTVFNSTSFAISYKTFQHLCQHYLVLSGNINALILLESKNKTIFQYGTVTIS